MGAAAALIERSTNVSWPYAVPVLGALCACEWYTVVLPWRSWRSTAGVACAATETGTEASGA
jgi:hypothetical protein